MTGLVESATAIMRMAERRLDVVAHNVANISTSGYKRQFGFSELIGALTQSAAVSDEPLGIAVHRDHSQGQLSDTGNAFDMAISGNGYFKVRAGGNSRSSPRTTYLYELQTKTGEFLKYGISVNPSIRYSATFMKDKVIDRITSGTRADMMALEKQMVISNPGPLNREPWAVKARGGN